MPTTPNYGWNLPTVAGDLGAWGGILNTALTEVDTDLLAALAAKANLAGPNTFTGVCTFNAGLTAAGGISTTSVAAGTSVVIGADPTGPEFLRVGGGGRFAGNLILMASASLTLQSGSAFIGGEAVLGTDPGGTELLRVGGALRGTGYIALNNASANTQGSLETNPTETLVTSGTSGLSAWKRLALAGASVAIQTAPGGVRTDRVVVSDAGVAVTGNVIAASFAGSGAGLTNLPWASLTGVPGNVVNAITQAQGDARYRQIATALPWADLSGVPSNVVNAITQATADGLYRPFSAPVAWADVAKPGTSPWATRAASRSRGDVGGVGPNPGGWGSLDREDLIDSLIASINGLRFNINALVDDLRAQGIVT